ncbi:MAG: hypothetical protein WCV88_05705 [Patescibacteria group bacterium]
MFFKKKRIGKALEANRLIHDAISMGVMDKYITEDNLTVDDFELQLLARAINWVAPDRDYDITDDINSLDEGYKQRFIEDENQIYTKGLGIVNSDSNLEKLINHYVALDIHLMEALYPKNAEVKHTGIKRMKKTLFQSSEKEPNVKSANFYDEYKKMFIRFNEDYGKYGKFLKKETIDTLFDLISLYK